MLPDVIVVGAGVIGLSCALTLARDDANVMVASDGRPGATSAAAGMLCPSFEALHLGGPALHAMGAESLSLWDGFAGSLADDPGAALSYRRDGAVGVGFPPGRLDGRAAPVPPGVEASAAILVEGEGQVDPRALLRALAAACAEAGVRRIDAEALGVEAGGGRVVLKTRDEPIVGGAVVAASGAGAFASSFLPRPLVPLRGRAFVVAAVPDLPQRVVRSPSVYLCPQADGTLYVGATEEARDMPSAPDALWSEACWLMPGLREGRVVRRYDGVRPGTADGLPIVRRAEDAPGVTLALGHHRNGVLLAPLTAMRVAALTLG